MGFEKILVAIDESPLAAIVFEQALALVERENASCKVFHCIDSSSLSHYAPIISLEVAEEKAQDLLQRYQQKTKTRKVSADFSSQVGEPGRAICNLSQQWGADLIVIGRRGNTGLVEMLLGSVSNYVVHHAPCSVLVIQGESFSEESAVDRASFSESVKSPWLPR